MYVPDTFLAGGVCDAAYKICDRFLGCQSIVGRRLAFQDVAVGCRRLRDGSMWVCDVCSLYRAPTTMLFRGATAIFVVLGIWHLL
jgi:hypothetical protein